MVSVVHACSKAAVKNRLNSVIKTISLLLFQDDTALKNGTGKAFSEQRSSVKMDSGRGGPTLKTRKSRSARHVSKKHYIVVSCKELSC